MAFSNPQKNALRSIDNLILLMSPEGLSAFLGANIGPHLSRRAADRFAAEGDDVSGKWAALSPATKAIRGNLYGPGPINRRTGELENWVVNGGWFAYPTGFGASMRYPKNQPKGELRKKVETAQVGREYPRTQKRPVLGVNEADLIFFQTSLMFAVQQAI